MLTPEDGDTMLQLIEQTYAWILPGYPEAARDNPLGLHYRPLHGTNYSIHLSPPGQATLQAIHDQQEHTEKARP